MEQTCITIHNISAECNIVFASDSIFDILGWTPDEVLGLSCFDFFHPDEVPFARKVHTRGLQLDKAAVLHYARLRSRDGRWISCECCFTVVHDVLVASTSIYRQGIKSERRAIEAPQIRRIFSCSPRDPRYHMLEYLSPKFKMPPMEREPRAALILNRFTRNLDVMFATDPVYQILGLSPDEIKHKSFYRCIQENCLQSAIKCLESAKSNDSIAYLRFWYRDPMDEERDCIDNEDCVSSDEDFDGYDADSAQTSDSEDGGAHLGRDEDDEDMDGNVHIKEEPEEDSDVHIKQEPDSDDEMDHTPTRPRRHCRRSPRRSHSAGSHRRQQHIDPEPPLELEAVVSCTSDGLIVILRKARPPIPPAHPPLLPLNYLHENGLFAAPWAQQPIRPQAHHQPNIIPEQQRTNHTFHAQLPPQYPPFENGNKSPLNHDAGMEKKAPTTPGQPEEQLMSSIRDVAVFAWAVVGINGELAAYGRGVPQGEAQPPEGLPVWDPNAGVPHTSYQGPENQAAARWAHLDDAASRGQQDSVMGQYWRHPPPAQDGLWQQQYQVQHSAPDARTQQPWLGSPINGQRQPVPAVSTPEESDRNRYLWQ